MISLTKTFNVSIPAKVDHLQKYETVRMWCLLRYEYNLSSPCSYLHILFTLVSLIFTIISSIKVALFI